MNLRRRFLELDDALASHGVPPLTSWWRDGVGAWLDAYESGNVLELWVCCGRGAAKSTALYKLALFFTLFGDFAIPPGERHYAIVLSRLKEEAAKGISIIARYLTLLGVKHRVAGDVIDLDGMPRGIRVAAASVAASSGWRAFFVGKDERSKWSAGGVEDLDAEEIDTSASAMTATHALAPVVSFGSAWGAQGGFYDAITSGSDARKSVLGPTPTWIAAPHISKEDTQRKERDPRRWAREYACEFQSGLSSAFDHAQVENTGREVGPLVAEFAPALCIDSSGGRGDSWVYFVVIWTRPQLSEADAFIWDDIVDSRGVLIAEKVVPRLDAHGERVPNPDYGIAKPILFVRAIGSLDGKFGQSVAFDDVVDHLERVAKDYGATCVHGDQFQQFPLASAFARRGLPFISHTWSSSSKVEAIGRIRSWLRSGELLIERTGQGDRMRKELCGLQERIMPSGALGYGARRSGLDDAAAALMTAAMADGAGMLGGPIRKLSGSREIPSHEFESSL